MDLAKGISIWTSHTNEKAAAVFINMIARVMRDDMRTRMEDTKFFSFVMDGASDVSVMEQVLALIEIFQKFKLLLTNYWPRGTYDSYITLLCP